jgi:hypothetical protein
MPSLAETMGQQIIMGIQDIGVSIVNDVTREEMLYISLNKSKVIWTETKKTRVKPLSNEMNLKIEDIYRTHAEQLEANPNDKELVRKQYPMDGDRV